MNYGWHEPNHRIRVCRGFARRGARGVGSIHRERRGTAPLAAAHGTLPRGLAIDGKYVRNLMLTLSLSEHESGAPAAIAIAVQAPVSKENKKEGELTCARRLYATTPLHGATITGDALNCEPQSITLVVENGADALFQLKANQPTALQHAMDVAATPPFFFTCESVELHHGREERRIYKVYAIEGCPMSAPWW